MTHTSTDQPDSTTAPLGEATNAASGGPSLAGRRALVMGASGGLGGAIASRLTAAGAEVTGASRSQPAPGVTAHHHELDLSDQSSVRALCDHLGQHPVDILVNVSGGPPPGPVTAPSTQDWLAAFQQMVASIVAVTNAALPGMQNNGWGRVVTVTSSGTSQPIAGLGISNTVRSSLVGWSKTLASEVAADGVCVNLLQPGRIATGRVADLDEKKAQRTDVPVEEVRKASRGTIPMGRYGDPSEFGDAALFLCSDMASYVTGTTLRVDGGMIAGV